MNLKNKKHTRSSFNLYIVAGLYLLYIDYSIISNWNDIEPQHKILMAMAAVAFAVFAGGCILFALKGLKELKNKD